MLAVEMLRAVRGMIGNAVLTLHATLSLERGFAGWQRAGLPAGPADGLDLDSVPGVHHGGRAGVLVARRRSVAGVGSLRAVGAVRRANAGGRSGVAVPLDELAAVGPARRLVDQLPF